MDTIKSQEPALFYLNLFCLDIFTSLEYVTKEFLSEGETGRLVGLVTSPSTGCKRGRDLHPHGRRDPGQKYCCKGQQRWWAEPKQSAKHPGELWHGGFSESGGMA